MGSALSASADKPPTQTQTQTQTQTRARTRTRTRTETRPGIPRTPRAVRSSASDSTPKKVLVRGLIKEPYEKPPIADGYTVFKDSISGRRVFWKLGDVKACDFSKSIQDAHEPLFKARNVRVYFPIETRYYAVKRFKTTSRVTLAKALGYVEQTANAAAANFLKNDLGKGGAATTQGVQRALSKLVVSSIVPRSKGGNARIYATVRSA
jgi:hypothetical protein